jgi:hypothetical protein
MDFNSRLDVPAPARHQAESTRSKRESSAVCRERAANDLLASVSMLNANQRLRMETSAAMWAERAETLQRVEDGLARRTAETAAKSLAARNALRGDEDNAEPARL